MTTVARSEIAKELPWVRRYPSCAAAILLNGMLVDGVALFLSSGASSPEATLPGITLLGAGAFWLFGLSALLERDRSGLWPWAACPGSISRTCVQKTLLSAALATIGALPVAAYGLRSVPSVGQAVPGLLYAAGCLVVLAFLQSALWLGRVSANAPTSPSRHAVRSLQLSLIAGLLATPFAQPTTATFAVNLVLASAYAFTSWQGAGERLAFASDPTAATPRGLTATYALTTIVAMRFMQALLSSIWGRTNMPPSRRVALAFIVAGAVVLSASFVWLHYRRGVTQLRERLGLRWGRGLRAILREGVLWSLPAIAVNQGYWLLFERWAAQSTQEAARQPSAMELLGSSALAAVGVGCVAAPLIEEILYRGLLYRTLRAGWGHVLGLLVSAAVFTVDHPPVAAVPIFCMAACATLAFERSRSLYAALLTHALYNGVIAFIVLSR